MLITHPIGVSLPLNVNDVIGVSPPDKRERCYRHFAAGLNATSN